MDARDRLPNLRALFLGDITWEENEISWIAHGDVTGLLTAFPQLEHFRLRGADGLTLRKFKHENLKSLTIEASNLQAEVVRAIGASSLPALEHLEIWLGTERYEANTRAAIDAGVFGAPSYVVDGEIFWGQDRLDFVERKLRAG